MFRSANTICGFALVLLVGTNGHGADADGHYRTYVTASCGEYLKHRKDGSAQADLHYINALKGYVTAINMSQDDTYDILGDTDVDSAMAWIDKFCQENPLRSFSDALQMLKDELNPSRQKSSPE